MASNNQQREAAVKAFLKWADTIKPGLKDKLLDAANTSAGLGQVSPPSIIAQPVAESETWWQKVLNAAPNVFATWLQTKQQKDVAKLQLDRARQGLAPLDVSQYAPPPITVQHEVTTATMSPETKSWLITGAVVLGLVFLGMR